MRSMGGLPNLDAPAALTLPRCADELNKRLVERQVYRDYSETEQFHLIQC